MSYEHQDWNAIVLNPKNKTSEPVEKPKSNFVISQQAKIEADIDAGKSLKTYGHEYGQKVQKARCDKKLTQDQLAQQLNVKKDIVQKIENGTGLVDGQICGKIFRILSVKRN